MAIKQVTNENERMCFNLISQPTLDKVKSDRLVLDYYDACVGHEIPVLVEDVRFIGGDMVINPDKKPRQDFSGAAKVSDSYNSFGGDNSFLTIEKDRKHENRENILQKIVDSFPEIKKQAEELDLPEELE